MSLFNPNKAGLFEGSFSWEQEGGGQYDHLSYFKKNLSNINVLKLLNNLFKVC